MHMRKALELPTVSVSVQPNFGHSTALKNSFELPCIHLKGNVAHIGNMIPWYLPTATKSVTCKCWAQEDELSRMTDDSFVLMPLDLIPLTGAFSIKCHTNVSSSTSRPCTDGEMDFLILLNRVLMLHM